MYSVFLVYPYKSYFCCIYYLYVCDNIFTESSEAMYYNYMPSNTIHVHIIVVHVYIDSYVYITHFTTGF